MPEIELYVDISVCISISYCVFIDIDFLVVYINPEKEYQYIHTHICIVEQTSLFYLRRFGLDITCYISLGRTSSV